MQFIKVGDRTKYSFPSIYNRPTVVFESGIVIRNSDPSNNVRIPVTNAQRIDPDLMYINDVNEKLREAGKRGGGFLYEFSIYIKNGETGGGVRDLRKTSGSMTFKAWLDLRIACRYGSHWLVV